MTSTTTFDPKDFLRRLTHRPGVYRMLNAKHEVIYVGKARDLKKRVASYFTRAQQETKTAAMLQQVADVEVTVTNTEAEALLLEYSLIKRHKPRFNVVLRDDKSYPYIYAATEHPFPRLRFHRGPRKGQGRYFGPYPSTTAVRQTLNELQKLFMIRPCRESFFRNRSRPCLQYQIKRCTAPCVAYISEEQYAKDFAAAMQFLEGDNQAVIDTFVRRMEDAAAAQNYEQAARYRDQIAKLKEVAARQLVSRARGRDLDVLGYASNGALTCVTVLFIRNGTVIGSRDHFPHTAGENRAAVLNGFVSQYYLGREAPREILLDTAIEDASLLEETLSVRSGYKVEIRTRVRGDRQRWLTMARTNAENGLNVRVASNATLKRQFRALSEVLELEDSPDAARMF